MAGISAGLEMTKNKLIELINDGRSSPDLKEINNSRNDSELSVLHIGSALSDCSEDKFPNKFERHHSLQDLLGRKSESKIPAFQRGRSNSDGAAIKLNENSEAFPSLPNYVLEKMGLHGDVPRDRLTEETLEQKFTSLALAFTIDAATIKDRCKRQRRTRDQTESNFNLEIEKLKEKIALLQPLCTDFESAELLSILFAQVEILSKAASLVAIAAERYGAVQHEDRLTESVQLMVTYVQALKQQRDSARRQLQYTKKVLQEPLQPTIGPINNQKSLAGLNKKILGNRRASIDSVHLQQDPNFKLNRRISDLSFRASLASKNTRPTRLELGMELNKIKEISLEEPTKEESSNKKVEVLRENSVEGDIENEPNMNCKIPEIIHVNILEYFKKVIKKKLLLLFENIQTKTTPIVNKWTQHGYLNAFLNSCAVLCFSVSILTLVSIFLEHEYVKGTSYWFLPWKNRKH